MDRRNTGQWIILKRPTIRERANEFAVDVDRASAHAGDDLVLLQVRAAHADENHVLFGQRIVQDADDLDLEALRLGPFEHRQAIAFHARG